MSASGTSRRDRGRSQSTRSGVKQTCRRRAESVDLDPELTSNSCFNPNSAIRAAILSDGRKSAKIGACAGVILGTLLIRVLRVNGNSSGAVFMRGLTILFFLALSIVGFAASSFAHEKIRLAQSSPTITCMMTCNSQYANCQSSCLATGTQLQSSALGLRNSDPNANQVCLASCTNQQLQCQIVCARSSPSR